MRPPERRPACVPGRSRDAGRGDRSRARAGAAGARARGAHPRPRAGRARAVASIAQPAALPTPLTSFVGRAPSSPCSRRRRRVARLVTIVGPAGVGKRGWRSRWPVASVAREECWFVELAPVTDPRAVPEAVAAAIGAPDQTRQRHGSRAGRRRPRRRAARQPQVLVVLDNCEHVLDAAAASRAASAVGVSRAPHRRHEPRAARGRRRAQVAARRRCRRRRGHAVLGPAEAVQPRFAPTMQRARRRRAVPPPRRPAAGHRARGGADQDVAGPGDRRAAERPVPAARRPATARRRLATTGCARRSTGATTCSSTTSSACSAGSPSSPAAPPSRPPRRSAAPTRSTSSPDSSTSRCSSPTRRGATGRFRMLESLRAYALDRLAEAGESRCGSTAHLRVVHRPGRGAEPGSAAPTSCLAGPARRRARQPPGRAGRRRRRRPDAALRLIGALIVPWWFRGRGARRGDGSRCASRPRPNRTRRRW